MESLDSIRERAEFQQKIAKLERGETPRRRQCPHLVIDSAGRCEHCFEEYPERHCDCGYFLPAKTLSCPLCNQS